MFVVPFVTGPVEPLGRVVLATVQRLPPDGVHKEELGTRAVGGGMERFAVRRSIVQTPVLLFWLHV